MNDRRTLDYLYFGYDPTVPDDVVDPFAFEIPERADPPMPCSQDPDRVIRAGIDAWLAAFADATAHAGLHVVPLSGGFDSRAILGGLLRAGLRDRIVTATFGTPGTLDFDLGRAVARHAGLDNHPIDLGALAITQDGLDATVRDGGAWSYLLDTFVNRTVIATFGTDAVYWTGHLGDPVTGGHMPRAWPTTWESALATFLPWTRFEKRIPLTPPDYRPADSLPDRPWVPAETMPFYEQLDFAVRQERGIRPILFSPRADVRAPFAHPDWLRFMLRRPDADRRDRDVYLRVMRAAFPDLFALPVKPNHGLPLGAPRWRIRLRRNASKVGVAVRRALAPRALVPHAEANYLDVDRALRLRADLREVVRDNVEALRGRRIVDWIDPARLWRDHQDGRIKAGRALLLLGALEVNLRAAGR